MRALLKKIVRTEPVRLASTLEALAVAVAAFSGLITPEQSAALIAAILAAHKFIRSIVYAPRTVENLVTDALTRPDEAPDGA